MTQLILRLGLGIVFLAFGIGKLQGDEWAETMRSMEFFQYLPWQVGISIILSGILEIVTGACLILGLFRRLFSFVASVELLFIIILLYSNGMREIRDIGLISSAIVLYLTKDDFMSLDKVVKQRSCKR